MASEDQAIKYEKIYNAKYADMRACCVAIWMYTVCTVVKYIR